MVVIGLIAGATSMAGVLRIRADEVLMNMARWKGDSRKYYDRANYEAGKPG
jgi:hypothetical protein